MKIKRISVQERDYRIVIPVLLKSRTMTIICSSIAIGHKIFS
ncbi:hypothetical protein [Paenibacillus sp. 32O-W]|nr:hypothetical protein [Paenibacillus sp. 32O-W]